MYMFQKISKHMNISLTPTSRFVLQKKVNNVRFSKGEPNMGVEMELFHRHFLSRLKKRNQPKEKSVVIKLP